MASRRWTIVVCVILMNIMSAHAHDIKEMPNDFQTAFSKIKDVIRTSFDISGKKYVNGLVNIISVYNNDIPEKGRRNNGNHEVILSVPKHSKDLPAAEPILPGHSLLRPSRGMLKSAVKYPLRDVGGAAVYGNLDNVGITWGKTRDRIRYSNFRKANSLKDAIKDAIFKSRGKFNNIRKRRPLIVIEIDPSKLGVRLQAIEEDNSATEENILFKNKDNYLKKVN